MQIRFYWLILVMLALPSFLLAEDPKTKGLGISRDYLQAKYEDMKFEFKIAPLEDGTPRVLGSSTVGITSVELIGPADDLSNILLLLWLPNDNEQVVTLNVMHGFGLLNLLWPKWEGRNDWFKEAVLEIQKTGDLQQVKRKLGDRDAWLSLEHVPALGFFAFRVGDKPKDD